MTLQETQQLLTLLKVSYPNSYKGMTKEEAEATIYHYHSFFGEYQTPIVVQALRNYIKKNQYPPTIAGLTEQIELLSVKDTDQDLWNLIAKACKNGSYGSVEEFNKLPPECQRWVGSPDNLKQYSQIDPDTFNTVTRGQFLKTIGKTKEKMIAQEELPQNVKDLLDGGLKKLTD